MQKDRVGAPNVVGKIPCCVARREDTVWNAVIAERSVVRTDDPRHGSSHIADLKYSHPHHRS